MRPLTRFARGREILSRLKERRMDNPAIRLQGLTRALHLSPFQLSKGAFFGQSVRQEGLTYRVWSSCFQIGSKFDLRAQQVNIERTVWLEDYRLTANTVVPGVATWASHLAAV
jgi:hypothetical protein